MKHFRSFDPAKWSFAWAEWRGGYLSDCGLHVFKRHEECARFVISGPGLVVIEEPEVYQGHKNTKGADAEDLLQVMKTVGALAAGADLDAVFYKPNRWKGQVPKGIMQGRIEKRLLPGEMRVASDCMKKLPAGLRHNVWDAVGIGLFYLGRL